MKAFLIYIILIPFGLSNLMAQSETYTSLEVDNFPVIEECQEENPNCFQESLKIYIRKNINIKSLTKYSSAKAYAQFVIMESGEIKDIKIRTTNKDLKKEAFKLLNKLEIKSPAMLNGAPVSMVYTTPISFSSMSINTGTYDPHDDLTNNPRPSLEYKDADVLPLYKECKSSDTNTCFEDTVTKRILNFLNFSNKMKIELENITELKIYFEIQPNGQFTNAMVLCESNKIMKELPTFINSLQVSEAAKDKNNNYISTFFKKTIVL